MRGLRIFILFMNNVLRPFAMEENLSEKQIEELLQIAESRLREHDQHAVPSKPNNATLPHRRSAKNVNGTRPYVSSNGQIARIDSSRVLNLQERQSANGIRRVEDPVLLKQRKIEVSLT